MTITIDLPKQVETQIKKRAESRGQDLNTYVKNLVERDVLPTWEELVRPIHEQSKRLGLTEKDIEELVDAELAAVRKITPLSSR